MPTVKEKFVELESLIKEIDEKHKLDDELLRSIFEYLVEVDFKGEREFSLISKLTKRLDLL